MQLQINTINNWVNWVQPCNERINLTNCIIKKASNESDAWRHCQWVGKSWYKKDQTQFTSDQMPLHNVGSQMNLYNTKYTASHLNIYTHQYLKGCVLFHLSYSLKRKDAQSLHTWKDGRPVITDINRHLFHTSTTKFTPAHFLRPHPSPYFTSCCLRQLGQFCRATLQEHYAPS